MSFNPTITQSGGIARDERGLSTVEYVIILVLIAAAAVGAWQLLGGTVKSKLEDSNTAIRDMNGNGRNSSGQGQSSGRSQSQPSDSNGQATPTPSRAAGKVDD